MPTMLLERPKNDTCTCQHCEDTMEMLETVLTFPQLTNMVINSPSFAEGFLMLFSRFPQYRAVVVAEVVEGMRATAGM